MNKRFYSLILSLLVGTLAIMASDTQVDGIWYNFNDDDMTASVTFQGDSYNAYSDEYSGSVVIPSMVQYNGQTYYVTSIGFAAFMRCSLVTNLTIPNSIIKIESSAVRYCSGLTHINIPNSVKSIGSETFDSCTGLTSLTIPNGVESIGSSAFQACTGLKSVTINGSAITIDRLAFWECTGIESITCQGVTPPNCNEGVFDEVDKTIPLYVPSGSIAAYRAANVWSEFTNIQALPTSAPSFPGDPGTITYKLQLGAAVIGGDSLPDYTPEGAGGYAVGTSVTITAQDIPGYQFVQWSDSVTDKSRSIVIEQSTSLTAYYTHSQIEIAVAANAWTFFCLPAVGKPYSEEMFEYVGLTNVKWGTYNGGTRAAGKSGWETPESFNAQQGYIIYSTTAGTLRINAYETDLPSGDVSVSIVDYSSSQPENAGWNFLGNPYSQGYSIAGLAAAGIESPITVWNGTGYDTYTPGIDTYILQPFEAFFIQKAEGGAESVTFEPEYATDDLKNHVEGELPGHFSVSATKQVQFSRGNLQYQASTGTWRFAEHQYDTIGVGNKNINNFYDNWIDLFKWGKGDDAMFSSSDDNDYNIFIDWGNNAIINGGNKTYLWRTLSSDEWQYLFMYRPNAILLYGIGTINTIKGMILLPDNWNYSGNISFMPTPSDFTTNSYTDEEWNVIESAGAVFLPMAGGEGMILVGNFGLYWSSTPSGTEKASDLQFTSELNFNTTNRHYSLSVRLVR